MQGSPILVCFLGLAVCCGGGSSGDDVPNDTVISDGLPSVFTLTSPMLTEGAAIMTANTCDGANTSPQLDWIAVPSGTMSFAIVLTDKANLLRHSVIYDIPVLRGQLPADVDKVFAPPDVPDAHQTKTLGNGNPFGYFGPCPPVNGGPHTYELALYALDVATLPGADMTTSQMAAETIILQHDLAKATLTGHYER